ncbi:MAG TPA: STN domain-containing protein, partial [Candidatus Brocadiaceae bacterium]
MHLKALCSPRLASPVRRGEISPKGKFDLRWLLSKQTLLIMKFTAIILLSACLTASAKGFSQITLAEKNAPLQKIFKEIQKQSGYDFLFSYTLLEKAGNVTVTVKNVSLQQAVEEVLKGKNLTYEILEKTVVIKP